MLGFLTLAITSLCVAANHERLFIHNMVCQSLHTLLIIISFPRNEGKKADKS